MSLDNLALISQVVASFAVIVSLTYAGLQFRIYAKAAREAQLVAATSDIQQFRMAIAQNADIARIYRDGLADPDTLDSIEQWRFGALMQHLVGNFILSHEFREAMKPGLTEHTMRWIMSRPGAKAGGRKRNTCTMTSFVCSSTGRLARAKRR